MKKPFFLILAIQLLLINSQLTQAQSVSLTQGSYTGATFSVTTPVLVRWMARSTLSSRSRGPLTSSAKANPTFPLSVR